MKITQIARSVLTGFIVAFSAFVIASCGEKGPAEKAGEEIDDKTEDVKDKAEDVVDKAEDKVDKLAD